jgi:eukaryotic-like serine/threonine-protein kinase
MILSAEQLKSLSQLADRWLVGDGSAREALVLHAHSQGDAFARAFDAMIVQMDVDPGVTDLPPISKAIRDVAMAESAAYVSASGKNSNGSLPPATPPNREPNQHVGPYRLIKELGRGGMGVVWLAERADGQHSRQVALKMPLVENLNWLLAARFARERNILASLEHPSIARLYDAGVDEHTQPYIAIEYVQGVSITEYVKAQRLKPEAIARLFIRVIEAVAHAHTQLVIHRDIKPSNILVDAKGEPHLLDFGIAKLLDDEESATAEATQLTRLSGRAFTLDYASPEQVNNASLGTASDVYSLGVVLYELLTGGRPYRPKGPTRRDLEQAILEQDPGKPSDQRLTTGDSESGKSARRMRGDLDTVVLKALRKDAKFRYATAQAFADDLRRYIEYQPIHARPDGFAYRASKFIRRHRVAVALAAVVAASLVSTSVVTTIQKREAQLQREEARFRADDATSTNDFFFGLLSEIGTSGKPLTPSELLDRGRQTLDRRYVGDPRFMALMYTSLAVSYAQMGHADKEAELRAKAINIARAQPDGNVLAQVLCSEAPRKIRQGLLDAAQALLKEAREKLQAIAAPRIEPQTACFRAEAAYLEWSNQHVAAIEKMQNLVAFLEREHDTRSSRYVGALNDLAHFLSASDRPSEAIGYVRRAGEVLERTGRSHSVARITNLQIEAFTLDRFGETRAASEVSAAAMRRMQGDDLSQPRVESAYSAMDYGVGLHKLADPAATRWFEYAANLAHTRADTNTEMQARTWLAWSHIEGKRLADADAQLLAAERWFATSAHTRFLDRVKLARAGWLLASNDAAAAAVVVSALLKGTGYPEKTTSSMLPGALRLASKIEWALGNSAEAERYANDALRITERSARDPNQSATVGQSHLLIAKARLLEGKKDTAKQALQQALPGLSAGLGEAHPLTLETHSLIASLP